MTYQPDYELQRAPGRWEVFNGDTGALAGSASPNDDGNLVVYDDLADPIAQVQTVAFIVPTIANHYKLHPRRWEREFDGDCTRWTQYGELRVTKVGIREYQVSRNYHSLHDEHWHRATFTTLAEAKRVADRHMRQGYPNSDPIADGLSWDIAPRSTGGDAPTEVADGRSTYEAVKAAIYCAWCTRSIAIRHPPPGRSSNLVARPTAPLSGSRQLRAASASAGRGRPIHTTYLFKHALVQDTAYGTLLREPRRALHARIAETLESRFAKIAESHELLARHYTEAGVIEKAARLWGKAGDRSLARSAFKEAAEQLARAISQTATLPCTPTSRREEIKLHAALRNVLVHLKGYAAPESKEALERARLLVEQAERRGEPPENPLLLFSLLNGLWTANIVSFNGDAACGFAAEFLTRAKNQNAAGPIVDGYRLVGTSLLMTGDIAGGRAHFDRGIGLGDPIDCNPLVTSTGGDARVVMLGFRSVALWLLGYPKAALADTDQALSRAREITPLGTLMHTLSWTTFVQILCGHYMTASALVDELVALADEKDTAFWKAWGRMNKGWLVALAGKASDAVRVISSGLAAWRATEATMCVPFYLSCLATVYMQLNQFEEAQRAIDEAITMTEKTSERWFEAEIHRMAGEIALKSPEEGAAKAEAYFQHALSVARAQQAKCWELRTAVSLAQLRRDQGKRDEARDVLTPVYARFAEGLDTRDLKEAKALLDELAQ